MTEKDIKPIPKYIVERIHRQDLKACPSQHGNTRFYNYLTKYKKELCLVTVAVKSRWKKWVCKQVVVHGMNSERCYLKDVVYYYIAGYIVGWYAEGFTRVRQYYEDGEWGWNDDKYFNIYAPIVNREYLSKCKEFQYSAVTLYPYHDVLKYLRIWRQFPQAEMLVKSGLSCLTLRKQILRKIEKDKPFRKWLHQNREEIARVQPKIPQIFKAYKENTTISDILERERRELAKKNIPNEIKALFESNLDDYLSYLEKQKTDTMSYLDYYRACVYLGMDMTLNKNKTPHDFHRWHDIRIDEYHTAKALQEAEERKKYMAQFITVAEKYLPLQREKDEPFICVIARTPEDLIREGEFLNHCVGRMGYDQKFAREQSLIFFIRNRESPEKPFVTVEYSPTEKKILQCYGNKDSRPTEEVLTFVNKVWLPYANRKIKKIA